MQHHTIVYAFAFLICIAPLIWAGPIHLGIATPFNLTNVVQLGSVHGPSSTAALYISVSCDNLGPSSFTVHVQVNAEPTTGSHINNVQIHNYARGTKMVVEAVVPPNSFVGANNEYYIGVFPSTTVNVMCTAFVSVSPIISTTLNTPQTASLTPPSLGYFSVDLASGAKVLTMRLQHQQPFIQACSVRVKSNTLPTYADDPIVGNTIKSNDSAIIQEFITASQTLSGRVYIAVTCVIDGGVHEIDTSVQLTVSSSAEESLDNSITRTTTLPPNANAYYFFNVPYPSTAAFIEISYNSVPSDRPMFALESYPAPYNTLQEPNDIYVRIFEFGANNVTYRAAIPAAKVQSGIWRIRVINTQSSPITYAINVQLATEAILRIGDQVNGVLQPKTSGLFRFTISSALDDIIYIGIVSDKPMDVWLNKEHPPLAFDYLPNVASDLISLDNGRYLQHFYYATDSPLASYGSWYGRVVPKNDADSSSIITYTIAAATMNKYTLGEFSILGGELTPFDAYFYQLDVPFSDAYSWMLIVQSEGGIASISVQYQSLPTATSYDQNLIKHTYQWSWDPIAGVTEAILPQNALRNGTWYAKIEAMDVSQPMSFAMQSILVDTDEITEENKPYTVTLSSDRMLFVTYKQNKQADLVFSVAHGDELEFIVAKDSYPLSFNVEADARLSFDADNTAYITIPQAAPGVWYLRLTAKSFVRTTQVTVNPVRSPEFTDNPATTPAKPGSDLTLVYVLVPSLLIISILVGMSVYLCIRLNKLSAKLDEDVLADPADAANYKLLNNNQATL